MKKIIVSFMCIGLLTGSIASAITPVRLAQCAFASTKYNCAPEEKRAALAWFIKVPAAVVAVTAAVIGISISVDKVKEIREKNLQEWVGNVVEMDQARARLQGGFINPLYRGNQ